MNNSTTSYISTTAKPCDSIVNRVNFECIGEELNNGNSSLLQFLTVLPCCFFWFIYLAYYNSRLLGFILQKIICYFTPKGF